MSAVASLTRHAARGYSGNRLVATRVYGAADALLGWEHRLMSQTCSWGTGCRSFSYRGQRCRQLRQMQSCSLGYATGIGRRLRHGKLIPLPCWHGTGSNLVFQTRTITTRQEGDSKADQSSDRLDQGQKAFADAAKSPSNADEDDDTNNAPQHRDSQMTSILKQMRSIPNLITMTRIASTPFISYLILSEQYKYAVGGCIVFGLTDWLDGYIAKNYEGQMTVLGTYLDPLADKIMVNVLALSLCYNDVLPGPIVALWLARDVGLIVTAYYSVALTTKSGDAVADPARTALKVEPTVISKVNTVLQFMTISIGMVQPIYDSNPDILLGLCWITAGTTVASALSYVDGASLTKSGNTAGGSKDDKKL